MISGFGGSMHYGDSIKLSKFPAGRRLREHIGLEDFEHYQRLAEAFFGFEESAYSVGNSGPLDSLDIRRYPVAEVGESRLAGLIDRLHDKLLSECKIMMNARVINIERKSNGGFLLYSSHDNTQYQHDSEIVIIGTGRSGITDTVGMLHRLGVKTSPPSFSIGIRLELPAIFLESMYLAHPDFKYSKYYNGSKVKSFCFSSSSTRGGRIKFCHYQDQFSEQVVFLDGHSHVETEIPPSQEARALGNFALLIQRRMDDPEWWIASKLVPKYKSLYAGKPFYEPLVEFMEMPKQPRFLPSVTDLRHGRVSDLFDKDVVVILQDAIRELFSILAKNSGVDYSVLLSSTNVIAPELECFWPTVQVSESFETDIHGLYVIGDAAGIAQGIIQAATSGFAAANHVGLRSSS